MATTPRDGGAGRLGRPVFTGGVAPATPKGPSSLTPTPRTTAATAARPGFDSPSALRAAQLARVGAPAGGAAKATPKPDAGQGLGGLVNAIRSRLAALGAKPRSNSATTGPAAPKTADDVNLRRLQQRPTTGYGNPTPAASPAASPAAPTTAPRPPTRPTT